MKMKRRSLHGVMIAYAFAVGAFILAALITYVLFQYRTARQYVLSSYEGLSSNLEFYVSNAISDIRKTAFDASYSSSIQRVVFTDDPVEYFAFRDSSQSAIDFMCDHSAYIDSIFILSKNDRCFYNTGASIANFRKEWGYGHSSATLTGFPTGFIVKGGVGEPIQLWYSVPMHESNAGYFDTSSIGLCTALCDLTSLTGELEIGANYDSCIALTYDGTIVSSNRALSDEEQRMLTRLLTGEEPVKAVQNGFITKAVNLPNRGWQLAFITPESAIDQQAITAGLGGLAMIAAFVIMTAAFLVIATSFTVKPVNRMLDEFRLLRESNWHSRISDSAVAEYSEIIRGINDTLDNMQEAYRSKNESQERLYQAVIAQNKAKLDAYRMQINPHFLFNTLEYVRSLASDHDMGLIEEMICSLSHMFRYTLESADFVRLREEVQHLEHYLKVMDMRFPGRFSFRCMIDERDLDEITLCSMLLQPLAENSIHHGFANKQRDCRMLLQCKRLPGGAALIRFTDNGCGLSPARLSEIRAGLSEDSADGKRDSIALSNIHHRLQFLSAGKSGLIIGSKEGRYTSVSFEIAVSALRYISGETP